MGGEERREKQKVTSRDIPRLLAMLAGGDPNDQADTLTLLCPCRNVRYDKEVWLAICRAAACTDCYAVRDRAEHAIGTLRERARTDPRSQALVRWLVEQGVAPAGMAEAIPAWRPRDPFAVVNGLIIPRYERPKRSLKNRSRR